MHQCREPGQALLLLERAGDAAIKRVGNGAPIAGLELRIGGEHGVLEPPWECGELHMRGTSMASAVDGRAFDRDWIATGDLAAMVQSELVLLDRLKELIKVSGESLAPFDLELEIAADTKRPAQAIAVVRVLDEQTGSEAVVVFIESSDAAREAEVAVHARHALLRVFPLRAADVVFVSRSGLPRTSSGR